MKIKIALAIILSFLVGCAATVPEADFKKLQSEQTKCASDLNEQVETNSKLEEELSKWKPADYEIEKSKEALESLTTVLDGFSEEFADFMANSSGEQVEVKADQIAFLDDYTGALVRVWLRFPDALAKYYMMFVRDNDKWKYVGYFQVGVVSIGDR